MSRKFKPQIWDIMSKYGYEIIHRFNPKNKTYSREFKDHVLNINIELTHRVNYNLKIFKAPILDGKPDWRNDSVSYVYNLEINEVEGLISSMNRDSVIDDILADG